MLTMISVFVPSWCFLWPVLFQVQISRYRLTSCLQGVRFCFIKTRSSDSHRLVYTNSFLATLNVRDHLREGTHSSSGIITTSNFIQPRTGPAVQNSTHELDDFPRSKDPQNVGSLLSFVININMYLSLPIMRILTPSYL